MYNDFFSVCAINYEHQSVKMSLWSSFCRRSIQKKLKRVGEVFKKCWETFPFCVFHNWSTVIIIIISIENLKHILIGAEIFKYYFTTVIIHYYLIVISGCSTKKRNCASR